MEVFTMTRFARTAPATAASPITIIQKDRKVEWNPGATNFPEEE
jgi:hypothetical protein